VYGDEAPFYFTPSDDWEDRHWQYNESYNDRALDFRNFRDFRDFGDFGDFGDFHNFGNLGDRHLLANDRDLAGQFGDTDGFAVPALTPPVPTSGRRTDRSVTGKQLSNRDGPGAVV
jgi:hypothetical protein